VNERSLSIAARYRQLIILDIINGVLKEALTNSTCIIEINRLSRRRRWLFDRVALANERFDDEWIEDVCDLMRDKRCLVGRQDWDSGGPGAGAGTVDVYQFRGVFVGEDDVLIYGPFDSFAEAAAAVRLFHETDATTKIWVDPRFR
jgi:hypothetical protein